MKPSVMSSSGGSESFGTDALRIMAGVDEKVRHCLDEARRAADEDVRIQRRRPAVVDEAAGVDPADLAAPTVRCLARVRVGHVEPVIVAYALAQLIGVHGV